LAVDRQQQALGFISGGLGADNQAWLLSIASVTESRRRGAATLLLERLLRALQEDGRAESVLLTVDPKNQPAYQLFTSWGWAEERRVNAYFSADDQRLVLRLVL
jgi:ribosomal-protein-alanine N-acetyltransferase